MDSLSSANDSRTNQPGTSSPANTDGTLPSCIIAPAPVLAIKQIGRNCDPDEVLGESEAMEGSSNGRKRSRCTDEERKAKKRATSANWRERQRKEKEDMKNEIEKGKMENEDLKNEIEREKKEKEDMKNVIERQEKEMEDMENEIERQKKKEKDLKNEIEMYKAERSNRIFQLENVIFYIPDPNSKLHASTQTAEESQSESPYEDILQEPVNNSTNLNSSISSLQDVTNIEDLDNEVLGEFLVTRSDYEEIVDKSVNKNMQEFKREIFSKLQEFKHDLLSKDT